MHLTDLEDLELEESGLELFVLACARVAAAARAARRLGTRCTTHRIAG